LRQNNGIEWIEYGTSLGMNAEDKTISLISSDGNHNLNLRLKPDGYITLEIDEIFFGLFRVKQPDNTEVYAAGMKLSRVLAIYRNLRENYEYRMRYDEAGKFFIREMELKRNYREVSSIPYFRQKIARSLNKLFRKKIDSDSNLDSNLTESKVIYNGWLRRNLSLTGLYHFFFMYGESLRGPFIFLLLPLFIISTLYMLIRNPPPSLNYEGFIHSIKIAFRSALDILQIQNDNPKLIDNAIRVTSLAIFGTLFIPLRRRFERRFRH
jgi:hypothetical protein